MGNGDALVQLDLRHLVHPHRPIGSPGRPVFVEGRGCTLTDHRGREYLDTTGGGLWVTQIGHGRREMAEAAAEQMSRLEFTTTFWGFSNEPAVRLAARLAGMVPLDDPMVYFSSGGSEANDAAIKAARYFHHVQGRPERTWILARQSAYHGLTYGGGSATGFAELKQGMGPHLPAVAHLTPPHPYRRHLFGDRDPVDFLIAELRETIERIGPDNIAAMIGEPIMGVAGFVIPPDGYWPRVAEVLREHGILLILDEVITAFGRTGEWFAASHHGIRPDIMVTAKGLTSGYAPLGATIMSREVADAVRADHGFPVGYTYSGHPVSCAVGLANLDIIEREDLLRRSRPVGEVIAAGLAELADLPVVGEVRHLGMGFALELVADKRTREPLPQTSPEIPELILEESGVIVRVSTPHVLVMAPPLVITEEEGVRAVEAVARALRRVRPDGTIARAESTRATA